MNPVISPSMTVVQIAELLEQHAVPDLDVYVRIESIRGKPVAWLMREPKDLSIPSFLSVRQAS